MRLGADLSLVLPSRLLSLALNTAVQLAPLATEIYCAASEYRDGSWHLAEGCMGDSDFEEIVDDAIVDVLLPSPSPFHLDLILVDWGPPASGWSSFQGGALWVRGRSSGLP